MDTGCAAMYETPYKLGRPVLAPSGVEGAYDALAVDCPFVFYHRGKFHMLHIGFDGVGYQTGLAESDDLVNWTRKGVILARNERDSGWDNVGQAGTWILKESNELRGLPTLRKVDNKYWMIYHSYPGTGYEAGPAEMGLAWTEDEELLEWHRLPQPIFSWRDGKAWERGGLYKACLIEVDGVYYAFYNAKNAEERWTEQIGAAKSTDLVHWERIEANPVLRVSPGSWDSQFVSDPCVVRDGEHWLMFYFGYDLNHAQGGLAVSRDLVHWRKLEHPILRHGGEGELDETHAHKSSVIYHNETLYHFYCAVRPRKEGDPANYGSSFRCITVAASRPWPESKGSDAG